MKAPLRELGVGVGVAAIVSIVLQGLEPTLGLLSGLLILPTIYIALWLARTIKRIRPHLDVKVVSVAFVAGLIINFLPIPARSLGARVAFYAQLAHYKHDLDAQCAPDDRCSDPDRVQTLITEGFGSIIQGVARDDSGTLLRVTENNERAPNPLIGCERGLVHLYGPYFHWGCG